MQSVKYHVKAKRLELSRILIWQSAARCATRARSRTFERETGMDRLFAAGNRQRSAVGRWAAVVSVPLAAVGPRELRCHRSRIIEVVSRDRSGIAGVRPIAGRDRWSGGGGRPDGGSGRGCGRWRGRDRARQRLWRFRRAADGHPASRHRDQACSRRLRRGVLGTGARSLPQHGDGVQGQGAVGDHGCRDAPAVRAGIPGRASGPDAGSPRGFPAHRSGGVSRRLRCAGERSICGPSLAR